MAQGIQIPLTITGVEEAKKALEQLKEQASQMSGDSLKEVNKEINSLEKSLDAVNKSFNESIKEARQFDSLIQRMDSGLIDVSGSISKMEDTLYAMALAGKENTQEFKDLQAETARFKEQVRDVDQSIDLLAENKGFAKIGTGLGMVSERLLSLDFEGAGIAATNLNKSISNIGEMGGKAIAGLGKTVTQLGGVFIKMGVSLAANPIFIIGAAIVAITVAVVALMNKFGLLQPIIDGVTWAFSKIGEMIDYVVQGFKDLTDWLGLTDHAGKKFVDNQITAFNRYSDALQKSHDNRIFQLDEEAKIANVRGEETIGIEEEKQKAILATARAEKERAKAVLDSAKGRKDIDAEEIKALREKIAANNELIKLSKSELRVIEAKKEVQAIQDAAKAEEDRARAAEKWAAQQKKYAQDRINFERQITDLILESMEEGRDKEISISNEKYARLIEDTIANESILETEKTKIVELLEAERERKRREIYAASVADMEFQTTKLTTITSEQVAEQIKIEQEAAAEKKAIRDAEYLAMLEANQWGIQAKLEYLNESMRIELENAELTEQQKTEIAEKYSKERRAIFASEAQTALGVAGQMVDTLIQLNDARLEADLAAAEGNEAKQTALKKKAFEDNKNLQIAQATIQMIQGAVSAFTNAMQLGPIAGPIVGGVLAAATIAMGIANIKKIKATKFEGGGGGAPTAPTGGAPSIPEAKPQVNMFGSANNFNETQQSDAVEKPKIEVVANVVEYEVTTSQNTVRNQKERSVL